MNKILLLLLKQRLLEIVGQNFDDLVLIQRNPLNIRSIQHPTSFLIKTALKKDFNILNQLSELGKEEKFFIYSNWSILSSDKYTSKDRDKFLIKDDSISSNPENSFESLISNIFITNPIAGLGFASYQTEILSALLTLFIDNSESNLPQIKKYLGAEFKEPSVSTRDICLSVYFLFPDLREQLPDVNKLYSLYEISHAKEILKIKASLL